MFEWLCFVLAAPVPVLQAEPEQPTIELLEFLGEWNEEDQKLIDSMSRGRPSRATPEPAVPGGRTPATASPVNTPSLDPTPADREVQQGESE